MKHTDRIFAGILAGMLLLGTVGCGKEQQAGRTDEVTSNEPDTVISSDIGSSSVLDTAVEETPGDVWLVPSEEECPTADLEDAPLVWTVTEVSPTQATLVLRAKDGSEFGIGYGLAYRIERFEEEGWVMVGPGGQFPQPAYLTSARSEHRDTVGLKANDAPLTPGYYRVAKTFSTTVNGKNVSAVYYAYFEIAE